jgi:hypothetical protein
VASLVQKKNLSPRKWIAIIATGLLVVMYMLAMLIVPALPLADPTGEIVAAPRLELWLIYVASLSDLWQQWTAGMPASFADRWPLVVGALAWSGMAWVLGRRVIGWDGLPDFGGRWSLEFMALAAGHALLCQLVLFNAWTFGTQSWLGLSLWVAGVWAASHWVTGSWWRRDGTVRSIPERSTTASLTATETDTTSRSAGGPAPESSRVHSDAMHEVDTDRSLQDHWSRRLIPLLGLASVWIAAVTLAGSCLPSFDADVREIEMLSMKEFMRTESVALIDRHGSALSPRGAVMPALAMAACSDWWPDTTHPTPSMSVLLQGVLTGQLIQSGLWLAAILLFAGMVRRCDGLFAAIFVAFLLISHPGMHELVRLGGGAGGVALWMMAGVGLLHSGAAGSPWRPPLLTSACIAAGAFGSSVMVGGAIGVPLLIAIVVGWWPERGATEIRGEPPSSRWRERLRRIGLLTLCCWMLVWPIRLGWYSANWWPQLPGFVPLGQGGLSTGHEAWWWALTRVLMDSVAHGLLLVPLAAVGILFRSDRRSRDAMGLGCIWLLVWWLFTEQLDRDWVIATPLIAWPASAGVSWLQRWTRGWVLMPCGWIALVWSVVVLSAWPLSDPRLLVPLERLTPSLELPTHARTAGLATDPGREGPVGNAGELQGWSASMQTAPRYCDWINSDAASRHIALGTDESHEDSRRKWLVVGNADTFFLQVPTLSSGVWDRCWFEDWILSLGSETLVDLRTNGAASEARASTTPIPWFREHRVGHVVMDWQGLARRDRIVGRNREGRYRDWVRRMLESGLLRRIPWDLNSGEAECFAVRWEE